VRRRNRRFRRKEISRFATPQAGSSLVVVVVAALASGLHVALARSSRLHV